MKHGSTVLLLCPSCRSIIARATRASSYQSADLWTDLTPTTGPFLVVDECIRCHRAFFAQEATCLPIFMRPGGTLSNLLLRRRSSTPATPDAIEARLREPMSARREVLFRVAFIQNRNAPLRDSLDVAWSALAERRAGMGIALATRPPADELPRALMSIQDRDRQNAEALLRALDAATDLEEIDRTPYRLLGLALLRRFDEAAALAGANDSSWLPWLHAIRGVDDRPVLAPVLDLHGDPTPT